MTILFYCIFLRDEDSTDVENPVQDSTILPQSPMPQVVGSNPFLEVSS